MLILSRSSSGDPNFIVNTLFRQGMFGGQAEGSEQTPRRIKILERTTSPFSVGRNASPLVIGRAPKLATASQDNPLPS
jgi:hypothetical protein